MAALGSIIVILCLALAVFFFMKYMHARRMNNNAKKQVLGMLAEVVDNGDGTDKGASLEELINRYHGLMIERLVRPSNDQKIKFQLLQSQVNPHFLYNTLESIRAVALVDGENGLPQIAAMTEALASYFRYNISNRNDLVTIAEEISNIEQYIIIQRFRFSDRFDLEVRYQDCDESVKELMIPKLLLQPIVENAIFHGLEGKTTEGKIDITIRDAEGVICIQIEDNGIGMPDDVLFSLQKNINQKELIVDSSESSHNGVALWQINQQIRTLFGEEFGMHLYSTEGIGTLVEVVLPKIQREKNTL